MADSAVARAFYGSSKRNPINTGVVILPNNVISNGNTDVPSQFRAEALDAVNTALSVKEGSIRTLFVAGLVGDVDFLKTERPGPDPSYIRYVPILKDQLFAEAILRPVDLAKGAAIRFKKRGVSLVIPVIEQTWKRDEIKNCFRAEGINRFGKILPCSRLENGIELEELYEEEPLGPLQRFRRSLLF